MLHFGLSVITMVRLSDNLTVAPILKSLWYPIILPSFSPVAVTGVLGDGQAALQHDRDHYAEVEQDDHCVTHFEALVVMHHHAEFQLCSSCRSAGRWPVCTLAST